jgi:putative ABC transport system permease protein
VADAARRLPGATATGVVATEVYLLDHHLTNEDASWPAAGLDPGSRSTLHLDVRSGSLSAVSGTGVAVSRTLADTGQVGVGSRIAARLADGTPVTLRIVAVYARANGLGDIVMAPRLALAHATAAVDQAVFVSGADRPSIIHGLARITRAVPGAALLTRAQYLRQVNIQDQQEADSQWVLDALMILVAILAAFNLGAIAAAERRPELALARLCGATRGQLTRSLALESLLTTLAGIVVGAIVVLVSVSQARHDPTGGPLALPAGQAALVVAGAAALGVGGMLIPSLLTGHDRLPGALTSAE